METDAIDTVRMISGAAVLLYCAWTDVRTRKADDWCWWLFLGLGAGLLELQLYIAGESPLFLLAPVYIVVFFVSLWYECEILGERRRLRDSYIVTALLNIAAFVILILQLAVGPFDPKTPEGLRHIGILTVPLMELMAYLFYRAQLLSGGADAKAFLSLAVLVPFSPAPFIAFIAVPAILLVICPFVLAVFFNAAFFTLFAPLGLLAYNLSRGDHSKVMPFAYRISIPEARMKKFIWLSECIEKNERRYLYFRFRGQTKKWKQKQLDALVKAGEKRVWVQPQIPFMVYLAAGFIFAFAVGNVILFGIIRLVSGV